MTWRDQLQKASFRDVPFFVDSAEGAIGRRSVVHEYPFRDRPFVEDLGRKARTFTFEAVVLGADYMIFRDRLLSALERGGPGNLVHPYLGALNVSVIEAKLKESTAEGGLARFSISVVEAGAELFVSADLDSDVTLRSAAERAQEAAGEAFESSFSVAGKQQYVADAAGSVFGDALSQMQRAASNVRSQVNNFALLAQQVTTLKQTAITTLYVPASAAQALVASIKLLVREVAYGPGEALGLARVFFRFGSELPNVPQTTAGRRSQAANQAAMTRLVSVVAVSEGARAAAEVEYTSYRDAAAVREELTDAIDAVAEAPDTPDALYDALRALRAATVSTLTARGADLARVTTVTPAATVPALVLAYRLYGDAKRETEIVARNNVPHPGFLLGAKPLEVLTDG